MQTNYDNPILETEGSDRLDVSSLCPISENPDNYYMQMSIARSILKDAICLLEDAETQRNDILERENILSKYYKKVYNLYPHRQIGDKFRRLTTILIKVITSIGTEVLDMVEIKILKETTKEIYHKMNDFSDREIGKIAAKLEECGLRHENNIHNT